MCNLTHCYSEVKRVLKPGGLYLFVEHVAGRGISRSFTSLRNRNNIYCSSCGVSSICFIYEYCGADGTVLRFLQNVLDPLQQAVSDGCHLTRETGKYISEAGFSGVNISSTLVRNASLVSPHVYGIACK